MRRPRRSTLPNSQTHSGQHEGAAAKERALHQHPGLHRTIQTPAPFRFSIPPFQRIDLVLEELKLPRPTIGIPAAW